MDSKLHTPITLYSIPKQAFKLEIVAFVIVETYIWKESFYDDIDDIFAEIELNLHWTAVFDGGNGK